MKFQIVIRNKIAGEIARSEVYDDWAVVNDAVVSWIRYNSITLDIGDTIKIEEVES